MDTEKYQLLNYLNSKIKDARKLQKVEKFIKIHTVKH